MKANCVVCGKFFRAKQSNHFACSKRCSMLRSKDYASQWRKTNEEKARGYCRSYEAKHPERRFRRHRHIKIACAVCGKTFEKKTNDTTCGKECRSARRAEAARNRYHADPEQARNRVRLQRAANPAKAQAAGRRQYAANPEKRREATKRWRESHLSQALDSARKSKRRQRETNPEHQKEIHRRWRESHTETVRELDRKWKSLYRASKRSGIPPILIRAVKLKEKLNEQDRDQDV